MFRFAARPVQSQGRAEDALPTPYPRYRARHTPAQSFEADRGSAGC